MGEEDSLKIKDICPFLFKTLAIHLILIIWLFPSSEHQHSNFFFFLYISYNHEQTRTQTHKSIMQILHKSSDLVGGPEP